MANLRPLTFDLTEVIQRFSRPQRIALTPQLNSRALKQEFGNRAIEAILERTNKGKDVKGNTFQKYSDAYKQSDDFQIFGKTARPVNLKLSGEMQASIIVLPSAGTTVKIGITGDLQNAKARRHNFGLKKMPRREFWGLSIDDQEKILKDIFRRNNAVERLEDLQDALNSLDISPQFETILQTPVEEEVSGASTETILQQSELAALGDIL